MAIDEERRDVARRLRDSAEERMAVKGTGNGNNWSWLYRSIFGHYMGTKNGAKGHYVEVAHRLADLIEPEPERTYHPERIGTAYRSAIVCSECKRPLDEVTLYCPHCGARLEGIGR